MAITDKLRAEVHRMNGGWCCIIDTHFDELCDRIDAEHEAMLTDARKTAYEGYIELPKDANGEYIHVGDVLMWSDGKTFTVNGIGDGTLFYYDEEGDSIEWTGTKCKRHYHAKTIEEVLDELLQRFAEDEYDGCTADLVAEYAAKLQLREES